ncbi:unnamed protein product [Brassica rapa subsp. trilocularis]
MRKETVVDFDCFFVLLEEMVKHRRSSSRSSSSSARFVSIKTMSIYLLDLRICFYHLQLQKHTNPTSTTSGSKEGNDSNFTVFWI